MLRRIVLVVFAFVVLSPFAAFAQQKTVVKDAKARTMLLGQHKVSLQWISWDYFGSAKVVNKRGVFHLTGEQRQREGNDFLRINGTISMIDKTSFTFNGTIETSVSHIKEGEVCKREGEMTFRITGKRRYWRLMQMDNPCDAVADYVDIYFR